MGDFKSRISRARTRLLRRGSAVSAKSSASSVAATTSSEPNLAKANSHHLQRHPPRTVSTSPPKRSYSDQNNAAAGDGGVGGGLDSSGCLGSELTEEVEATQGRYSLNTESVPNTLESSIASLPSLPSPPGAEKQRLVVTVQEPTPDAVAPNRDRLTEQLVEEAEEEAVEKVEKEEQEAEDKDKDKDKDKDDRGDDYDQASPLPSSEHLTLRSRPTANTVRRQSLVASSNARFIKTLLESDRGPITNASQQDYFYSSSPRAINAGMIHRKVWVKRPGSSATLVQISEDDLVDDTREAILRKYANSLGKSFDAPDVTLRIVPRDHTQQRSGDRILGPEEEMCRTLDAYYPGGQTVEEALIIEVPQRRTPRPSPRAPHHLAYYLEDARPIENGTDYFPIMPVAASSPGGALTATSHDSRQSHAALDRSMTAPAIGHVGPLPSPSAGSSNRRSHHGRPKYGRQSTSSPTAITLPSAAVAPSASNHHPPRQGQRPRLDSMSSDTRIPPPAAPPLPSPPAPEAPPTKQGSGPPTPRVASPRPSKPKRVRRQAAASPAITAPSLPAGLLDGSVPPINVLIVEDNIINLKLLEAFMKRLKVRWQTAMNGRDAVTKWRSGGFHLVLMDIQLPIMSGLEATKEIRRLERINCIGVFSGVSNGGDGANHDEPDGTVTEADKLGDGLLFKSPVIIVALTASSLQSDRHEALAAGCNDFLTKPVNFVWLERKVKEWGCMQALIDFDGWRRWKDFTTSSESKDGDKDGKAARKTPTKRDRDKDGDEKKNPDSETAGEEESHSDRRADGKADGREADSSES